MQILVSNGQEINVFDSETGELIKALKGHKDTIFSISSSSDGQHFASGGQDKYVILWDGSSLAAEMKYSHTDHVQSVSHNPVTGQVLSCTGSDFGLWSADAKGVQKYKVSTS